MLGNSLQAAFLQFPCQSYSNNPFYDYLEQRTLDWVSQH
jgi:hypothetical protein